MRFALVTASARTRPLWMVGITAGASAPEELIEALIAAIAARFDALIDEDPSARETVTFKLPRALAQ